MIRHSPSGRGHPYLVEPDQRMPVRPAACEQFELRATTAEDAPGVQAELEHRGTRIVVDAVRRGPAVADSVADWGTLASAAGEGHLSDLAGAETVQAGRASWVAAGTALGPGELLRYRLHGGGASTRWFEVRGCDWSAAPEALELAADAGVAGRLVPGSVSLFGDGELSYTLRFELRLEPGERAVGFGERFDGLDQTGRLVDAVVFDQYKGQGARTYLPTPFAIVAGGGFGFHVDTGRRVRFDVGRSRSDRILVEVDLEPGEVSPRLCLRLFAGTPAEVLGAFLAETGRPEPPPEWIYRLWISGNEWSSQARVLAEVDRSAVEGIPVGVVVIEAWSDEETFVAWRGARYDVRADGSPHRLADFSFPVDGPWPDPTGLVDELHRRGVRVLLWQIPLASSHPGQADADRRTMVERGYCVRDEDGEPYGNPGGWFHDALLLDFTSPEARAWWLAKRRYLVDEVGVDGFKTDGGEHAWHPGLRYADGTRGGETNNRYPVLYGEAYHQLLRSAGRKPVTFSRAGFTGSAAIPCHWAGDGDSTWEAFRASISAALSAGASGILFWGWDLAGFSGPLPSPELYLRAAAAACFCPVMQLHSEFNHHRLPSRDRTPWNMAEQSGDESVLSVFRRLVHLRERLVPYLAEQGERALAAGKPLMRALCFEVSGDDRIWDFPEQWLLGDDLLVAPVTTAGAEAVAVYLPAGEWVDAWTEAPVRGPAVVEAPAPLDRIPVFITAARAADLASLFRGLDSEAQPPRAEQMEVT